MTDATLSEEWIVERLKMALWRAASNMTLATVDKTDLVEALALITTLRAERDEWKARFDKLWREHGAELAEALGQAVGPEHLRKSAEALLRQWGEELKSLADRFRKEAADAQRFVDGGGMNRAMAREFIDQAYVRNDAANRISETLSRLQQAANTLVEPNKDGLQTNVEPQCADALERRSDRSSNAWDWLASRKEMEISFGYPDDPCEDGTWCVHRVSGNVNDREWDLAATGATPLKAVEAARVVFETPPLDPSADDRPSEREEG